MKPIYRSIGSYMSRIIASGPILYYPLNEKSGIVAKNWGSLGAAADGTITGVSLAAISGPKGGVAPYWDGINDQVNYYTAALAAAFSGTEATLSIWSRVYDMSVWTDGTLRRVLNGLGLSSEYLYMYKPDLDNLIRLEWKSGGVYKGISVGDYCTADWCLYSMTLSQSANQTRFYINGNLISTQGGGDWAEPLQNPYCFLGASSVGGATCWHGYLSHFAMWERVLPPAEISALYQ